MSDEGVRVGFLADVVVFVCRMIFLIGVLRGFEFGVVLEVDERIDDLS